MQPADLTLNEGGIAGLVVLSKSPKASYQWRQDGEPIEGATDNRLSLPRLTVEDSGATFDVVVKSPEGGEETSQVATITVTKPKAAKSNTGKQGSSAQWASHDDWNSQKPGYEWLFPFIDTNSDGKVTKEEYAHYRAFKEKSNDWQADVRKGGLK